MAVAVPPVAPTGDPDQIVETLKQYSIEEQLAWAQANAQLLDPIVAQSVVTRLAPQDGPYRTAEWDRIVDEVTTAGENAAQSTADQDTVDEITSAAVATGASPTEVDAIVQTAAAALGIENINLPTSDAPPWLLEIFGNQEPTEEQQQAIIAEWNRYAGVEGQVTTFEQAVEAMESTGAALREYIVADALDGTETQPMLQISLGKGRTYNVSSVQFSAAKEMFQMEEDELVRTIRTADRWGLQSPNEFQNLMWQPLAASVTLARTRGDELTARRLSATGLGDQTMVTTAVGSKGTLQLKPASSTLDTSPTGQPLTYTVDAQGPPSMPEIDLGFGETKTATLPPTGNISMVTQPITGALKGADERDVSIILELNEAARKIKEGLYLYGQDPTMAYIYSIDQGLAQEISTTDLDTFLSQPGNEGRVMALLRAGGFDNPEAIWQSGAWTDGFRGYAEKAEYLRALAAARGRGGGGGGGAIRQMPDPAAIKQQVTQLWQNLFRIDPSDEVLNSAVADINKMVMGTPIGQSIDITARIRDMAMATELGQDLFKSKPAGMTPEDYVNQALGAASSMLGNEAPGSEVIQSGLRGGDYQTTIGAVAGSAEAWDNSTFLGRLARVADAVSART